MLTLIVHWLRSLDAMLTNGVNAHGRYWVRDAAVVPVRVRRPR